MADAGEFSTGHVVAEGKAGGRAEAAAAKRGDVKRIAVAEDAYVHIVELVDLFEKVFFDGEEVWVGNGWGLVVAVAVSVVVIKMTNGVRFVDRVVK